MSIGDIILALIVAAVVFFAVHSVFVKKSVGCSGDCAHCGGSCHHSEMLTIRLFRQTETVPLCGTVF